MSCYMSGLCVCQGRSYGIVSFTLREGELQAESRKNVQMHIQQETQCSLVIVLQVSSMSNSLNKRNIDQWPLTSCLKFVSSSGSRICVPPKMPSLSPPSFVFSNRSSSALAVSEPNFRAKQMELWGQLPNLWVGYTPYCTVASIGLYPVKALCCKLAAAIASLSALLSSLQFGNT